MIIIQFLKLFSNFFLAWIFFCCFLRHRSFVFTVRERTTEWTFVFQHIFFYTPICRRLGHDASVRKLFSHTELTTTCFFRSLAAVISSSLSVALRRTLFRVASGRGMRDGEQKTEISLREPKCTKRREAFFVSRFNLLCLLPFGTRREMYVSLFHYRHDRG